MSSYGFGSSIDRLKPIIGQAIQQTPKGIAPVNFSGGAGAGIGAFGKMMPYVGMGMQALQAIGSVIQNNQDINTSNLDTDTASKLKQQTKKNVSSAGSIIMTAISALLMFLL